MKTEMYLLSNFNEYQFDFRQKTKGDSIWIFDLSVEKWELIKLPGKQTYPKAYHRDCNRLWREKKRLLGDVLWDSEVMTIQSLALLGKKVILEMSTCRYKDILYKQAKGYDGLVEKFSSAIAQVHTFTTILPVTDSNEVVLSIVGDGTIQKSGLVDLIGGTLNPQEQPVNSFDDIKMATVKELNEETNIQVNPQAIRLFSINYYAGHCFYLFLVRLNKQEMKKQFKPNHEIKALFFCSIAKLAALDGPISQDVLCLSRYAHELNKQLGPTWP